MRSELSAISLERVLFITFLTFSLLPVWGVYYTPLADFPEHVLITHAVARGAYDAGPDYQGRLVLRSLWAPYSFFYLVSALLARLMPAIWAVKLLLAASLAGTAFALRWLLRSLGRDPYAFYFGFPFLFSTVYLTGLIPYLAGIPVALVLAGLVLREPRTTARNFFPRLALQFLLLWAHPVLYAAMAATLALLLVIRPQAPVQQNRLLTLAWLALPAVYLAAWTPSLGMTPEVAWRFKAENLKGFFMNLGAYQLRVFDQPYWLPKLPLLAWLVWAATAIFRQPAARGGLPSATGPLRGLAFVAGMMALFSLVLPEAVSGRAAGASFRLAAVAALLAAGLLPETLTRPWAARVLLVGWCGAVLGGNAILARRFDRGMDGFVHIARRMEPRQTAFQVIEGQENVLFFHAVSYYHLEKGGISPQAFLTAPGLKQFPAHLPPPFPWKKDYWASAVNDLTDTDMRAFRYVVAKTSRQQLPDFTPSHHRLVARSGGWLLFLRNSEK